MLIIFISNECQQCAGLLDSLKLLSVPFTAIDANAEDKQELCDLNGVDVLPHLQIIDDNGAVVWQHSGDISLAKIIRKYQQHKQKS